MTRSIDTNNMRLLPCDQTILRIALEGNEQLAQHLGVSVATGWTEFGEAPLKYSMNRLVSKDQQGWWTWLPIHKTDNTLMGSGGYKGKPSPEGNVEIGYEIAPSYRNKGLASEFAKALTEHAFSFEDVNTILAHTLAEENDSCKVLLKCGFKRTAEINDPDDGFIWRWELKRSI